MTLSQWPSARAIRILRLRASYIMWGLISKLFVRVFSWQPLWFLQQFYHSGFEPCDSSSLYSSLGQFKEKLNLIKVKMGPWKVDLWFCSSWRWRNIYPWQRKECKSERSVCTCIPVPFLILFKRIGVPAAFQKMERNSGTHVHGAQSSIRLNGNTKK